MTDEKDVDPSREAIQTPSDDHKPSPDAVAIAPSPKGEETAARDSVIGQIAAFTNSGAGTYEKSQIIEQPLHTEIPSESPPPDPVTDTLSTKGKEPAPGDSVFEEITDYSEFHPEALEKSQVIGQSIDADILPATPPPGPFASTPSSKGKEPAPRDSGFEEIANYADSGAEAYERPEIPDQSTKVGFSPESPPSQDQFARVHTSIARNKQNSPPTASPTDNGPSCPFPEQSYCPLQQNQQLPQATGQADQVEFQEEETDPFSDYSDETASLTESINSLNYKYQDENGRRYHGFGDAAYLLPNDEREQERLEGQHQTWIMILGGRLHLAPLKQDIQNILDVATGTGNWAMDMADMYPSATVVGTDLSPIQPNFVPPNCSFIVEDSEAEWVWEERFDLIHSRTLASAWRDWPGYFQKCYEYLKPGGYVELHEFTFPFHCDDDTAPPDNPMMHWSHLFNEGCLRGGVRMNEYVPYLDRWLREAGFVDIVKIQKRQMFNGWSKDTDERRRGIFYGKIFDWGLSMALLTRRLGWSREAAELFLVDVRKTAADERVHAYIPLYIYTARKPESAVA